MTKKQNIMIKIIIRYKFRFIIYPFQIYQNNNRVNGEIFCRVDVKTKRPNIRIVFYNRTINYKNNEIIEKYFIDTIHHIFIFQVLINYLYKIIKYFKEAIFNYIPNFPYI